MVTFAGFVFIYVLGGLTFLPLLIAAVFCHAYLTFPERVDGTDESSDQSRRDLPGVSHHTVEKSEGDDHDDTGVPKSELDNLLEELKPRAHEPDVAAGYFAVCRDYVPGGVNGKPPERTTPAGTAVATESPSVYQSMYRSIFDRNKAQSPIPEAPRSGGRYGRKARNVFYVVLRLGYLMLFDDSEQLEVRYVISLEHHDVDVYSGGEKIPEGELWIKRNCIRLTKRKSVEDISAETRPFYLFSENQSDKENFYHALLHNQERKPGSPQNPPTPLRFSSEHVVKLVQQLHASEENLHTRWINALLGRVFLAVYRTPQVENFVRMKVTKKIARVPKPAFLSSIKVQKIDMGDGAPLFTHPKLRELTVDGDLTLEADIRYRGNFRLEIAAVVRIELGSRFKAREVNLVLAGILRSLEGHILVRVKPPPSNRLWVSFETMPKLELSIEPIVSSRQITYGVILRAIESRIREVIGETLVLPIWDDMPFLDTMYQRFRGGIWEDDARVKESSNPRTAAAQKGLVDEVEKTYGGDEGDTVPASSVSQEKEKEKLASAALVEAKDGKDVKKSNTIQRKGLKSTTSLDERETAISSGADTRPNGRPKSVRKSSFASVSNPVVNTDPATAQAARAESSSKSHGVAAAVMKDISSRSQPASPMTSPVGSPAKASEFVPRTPTKGSYSSKDSREEDESSVGAGSFDGTSQREGDDGSSTQTRSDTLSSVSTGASASTPPRHPRITDERRQALNQSLAAAKKWGWGVLNRRATSASTSTAASTATSGSAASDHTTSAANGTGSTTTDSPSSSTTALSSSPQPGTPSNPIGRGRPLPPPGQPLPGPHKPTASWPLRSLTKRKPVAAAQHPASASASSENVPPPNVSEGETAAATSDALPHLQPEQTTPSLAEEEEESSGSSQTPAPLRDRRRYRRRSARSSTLSVHDNTPSSPDDDGANNEAADPGAHAEELLVVTAPTDSSAEPSPSVDRRGGGDTLGADEGMFGMEMGDNETQAGGEVSAADSVNKDEEGGDDETGRRRYEESGTPEAKANSVTQEDGQNAAEEPAEDSMESEEEDDLASLRVLEQLDQR